MDSGTETNKLGALPPLLELLAVAPTDVVLPPLLLSLLLLPCLLLPLPLLLLPVLLDSVFRPNPTPTELAFAVADDAELLLLLLFEVVAVVAAVLTVAVVAEGAIAVPLLLLLLLLLAIVAVLTLANVAFTSAVADVWCVGGLSSVRCCKEKEWETELVLCIL